MTRQHLQIAFELVNGEIQASGNRFFSWEEWIIEKWQRVRRCFSGWLTSLALAVVESPDLPVCPSRQRVYLNLI